MKSTSNFSTQVQNQVQILKNFNFTTNVLVLSPKSQDFANRVLEKSFGYLIHYSVSKTYEESNYP